MQGSELPPHGPVNYVTQKTTGRRREGTESLGTGTSLLWRVTLEMRGGWDELAKWSGLGFGWEEVGSVGQRGHLAGLYLQVGDQGSIFQRRTPAERWSLGSGGCCCLFQQMEWTRELAHNAGSPSCPFLGFSSWYFLPHTLYPSNLHCPWFLLCIKLFQLIPFLPHYLLLILKDSSGATSFKKLHGHDLLTCPLMLINNALVLA